MRAFRWVKLGGVGAFLGQTACLGEPQTPLATAADIRPAPARGGWTVANTFGEVSFEQFRSGDFVIVPLRAYEKAGADPDEDGRFVHEYMVDVPDANLSEEERFLWGALPLHNGVPNGSDHWHHERLAFNLKSMEVFILPRRGLTNVDLKGADGTHFWCTRDVVASQTITIDGWYNSNGSRYTLPLGEVCPTAFVRSTRETKGIPLLAGEKEAYVIDTQFVATLIARLEIDDQVTIMRGRPESTKTEPLKAAKSIEELQQSVEAE